MVPGLVTVDNMWVDDGFLGCSVQIMDQSSTFMGGLVTAYSVSHLSMKRVPTLNPEKSHLEILTLIYKDPFQIRSHSQVLGVRT